MWRSVIEKPYHHGDLRATLLLVAADLLERDGVEALSLRAVARQIGVSQTALYKHFDGKGALLEALAEDGFHALRYAQERVLHGQEWPKDTLVGLGLNYVTFALQRPQRYRLMFGAGRSEHREGTSVAAAKRASFEPLKEALTRRLPQSDPGILDAGAVAAWALVHGLASLVIDGSLPDPRKESDGSVSRVETALIHFASLSRGGEAGNRPAGREARNAR